jgi:hypothetical protein
VGALLAACPLRSGAAVLDHVTFKAGDTTLDHTGRGPVELEIDSQLGIDVDEPGLLQEVAAASGVDPGMTGRIEELKTLVEQFLVVQQRLIEMKNAALRLAVARMAAAPRARIESLEKERDAASNALAQAGSPLLDTVELMRTENPELHEALSVAVQKDYAAMADVLRNEVQKLEADLSRRVIEGPKIQVLMTATLVDSEGRETALHLDGYDSIATGTATPFPRFRLTLDERARRELAAAAALAPLVAAIEDPASGFQKALDDLEATIKDLPEQLKLADQATALDTLATSLRDTGEEDLEPLADQVEAIKADLTVLSSVNLSQTTDILALADTVRRVVENVQKLRDDVPDQLEKLRTDLDTALGTNFPEIAEQGETALKGLLDSILENRPALKTFVDNLSAIASNLHATGGLTNAAEAASRKARELGADTSLDTKLDLQTIGTERHPGDRVDVAVQVERTDPEAGASTALLTGSQGFRLEKYGLWADTRGALLLVDPRSDIPRDVSYQPVPGIGYHWHYGLKNHPAVNHDLSFGLGASLALLDFEDDSDFELGIAASATFLRDLFWVGFGRNLQAKADYFFVGINPLILAEMFRR